MASELSSPVQHQRSGDPSTALQVRRQVKAEAQRVFVDSTKDVSSSLLIIGTVAAACFILTWAAWGEVVGWLEFFWIGFWVSSMSLAVGAAVGIFEAFDVICAHHTERDLPRQYREHAEWEGPEQWAAHIAQDDEVVVIQLLEYLHQDEWERRSEPVRVMEQEQLVVMRQLIEGEGDSASIEVLPARTDHPDKELYASFLPAGVRNEWRVRIAQEARFPGDAFGDIHECWIAWCQEAQEREENAQAKRLGVDREKLHTLSPDAWDRDFRRTEAAGAVKALRPF